MTAIFFDLDDTLINYQASERHGLSSALADLELPFTEEILTQYRRINKALWQAYARGEIDPAGVRRLRFEGLIESMGTDRSAAARLQRAYLNHFAACGVLIDGAKELLTRLKREGFISLRRESGLTPPPSPSL